MNNIAKYRSFLRIFLKAKTIRIPSSNNLLVQRNISVFTPLKSNPPYPNGTNNNNISSDIKLHYEKISNETLESLTERLDELSDDLGDLISDEYDVSFSNGVLNLKLGEENGTYVINKQTPNLQIWLSSPVSGPKRFDFIDNTWIYKRTGESLHELLAKELTEIFSTEINLNKSECTLMCPKDEVDMRIKNNLVNSLEKFVINSKIEYKLVKEYGRPAAGKIIKSSELRTLETLLKTTKYLIREVYSREKFDFVSKYEFIFDRLRAIRQDIIIERCDSEISNKIHEIILCFYLISDYKLCASDKYDEYLNHQHLKEVLHLIISSKYCTNKNWFYSVYLLLNLKNFTSINNTLKTWKSLNLEYPMDECVNFARAYLNKNYVKLFEIYKRLPLLCQLAFHRRIPEIEIDMLKIMNCAYSFKNSIYPVESFLKISLFNGRHSLEKYEDKNFFRIDMDNNILFSKFNSPTEITDVRERYDFIDEKLSDITDVDFMLESYCI
ncbi:unnamed protein product [Brachionus calyciflorus]|uniref:ferroxidase n=1 Tax=Brachionus calyciflorus TaxID=104777 RepID=A0A813N551_9BILA|nr:unnamed protein product [Brachionus calyciflorus]